MDILYMNTNRQTNFERDVWNGVSVIGLAYIILKRVNGEKCQVKMLPWQQFLPEFSESYREVMLALYEGIMKVWHKFTFMLSSKEQT